MHLLREGSEDAGLLGQGVLECMSKVCHRLRQVDIRCDAGWMPGAIFVVSPDELAGTVFAVMPVN